MVFQLKKTQTLEFLTLNKEKAIKKYKVYLFDLSTNNTNHIIIDNYKKIKIYRLINSKYNFLKIIDNYFFIKKITKKYKPSIIISSFLNIKNVIYSSFIKSKKIVLIHGSDANTKGFIRKFIFKFYLNKLDRIICVSNYTKKFYFIIIKISKIKQ